MSVSSDLPGFDSTLRTRRAFAQFLASPQFSAVLLALAVLQQALGHHNADNSWLFTVCEKWLDGARPYVDVIETNPPGSFLLYLPAAFFARLMHLPTELLASACVFAGALASLLFSGAILRRSGLLRQGETAILLSAAVFAFILMPGFSFAEREHVASFAILPALAIYAARGNGANPQWRSALLAGCFSGLAIVIKPHFALAIALPLLWLMLRQRSFSLAWQAENAAAGAVVFAYLAVLFLWFPEFFNVLPSIVDTYVPIKEPLRILLTHPWLLAHVGLLMAIVFVMRGRGSDMRVELLSAASLGFLLAFLVQGKGWVNHGLPGVALALLALVTACAPALSSVVQGNPGEPWKRLRRLVLFGVFPAAIGLSILFGSVLQFSMKREYPGLIEAVRRVAPPHPKIMALSGDLDVGHPLVRAVDGVWVGQAHSLWLMLCAQLLIDSGRGADPKFAAYVQADAKMFADNVRKMQPDAILVSEGERVALMQREPAIAEAMKGYAPAASVEDVAVWVPKTQR